MIVLAGDAYGSYAKFVPAAGATATAATHQAQPAGQRDPRLKRAPCGARRCGCKPRARSGCATSSTIDGAPPTLADYRNTVRAYLLAEFGERTPLGKIGTRRIDAYRERLLSEGRLSRRSIQKVLVLLHAFGRVWPLRRTGGAATAGFSPVVVAVLLLGCERGR